MSNPPPWDQNQGWGPNDADPFGRPAPFDAPPPGSVPPPPGSVPPPPVPYPHHWGQPDPRVPFGSPPPGTMAYGRMPTGYKPDNYLWATILTTVICCFPVGAFGIYFSSKVDSAWFNGDAAGAHDASRLAKNCAIASLIVGLVIVILVLVLVATVDSDPSTY